jgi:transcriptional regulator
VPTWNYTVVHAHGRVTVRDDERYVRALVGRLMKHHEAAEPSPWRMGDSPQTFINDMLALIVGLEIEITRLVGKSKLGQNKGARPASHTGRVELLGTAAACRRRLGKDKLTVDIVQMGSVSKEVPLAARP